jgi:hypothetical protein
VVGTRGRLGGYRWGIERKQKLLKREFTVVAQEQTRPPSVEVKRSNKNGVHNA